MTTYLGVNISFSQIRVFKCSPLGKENLHFEIKTGGL